jgi:uncharacterized glyoxalase superfamily protein PhnB
METTTENPTETTTDVIAKTVWPCVVYDDAVAAIAYLTGAFGFESRIVVADGDVVHHAELRWPEGGGIMLGSSGREESPFSRQPTGAASVYVVTDEPDALYTRATGFGLEIIREMEDTDYGSRGFSVRDAEGNLWSFGTYRGT